MIDTERRVSFEPETAWAAYYAFPVGRDDRRMYGFPPGHDVAALTGMRYTQMAWRLVSRVGQIPSQPFGDGYEPQDQSTYLEIRHSGYRPEFVALNEIKADLFEVRLSPVLHQRVAILDFPCVGSELRVGAFSQLIAMEIISELECRPELATFGYFSDIAPDKDNDADFFFGRPPIDMGNEILILNDVREIQDKLEFVDVQMVSDEGRFLQRKLLDVNFVVRGSYILNINGGRGAELAQPSVGPSGPG